MKAFNGRYRQGFYILICSMLIVAGCSLLESESPPSDVEAIEVVNSSSETIQVYALEHEMAQKAYWWWPDDPPLLSRGDIIEIPVDSIPDFEAGDELYIAIRAERHYDGTPSFVGIGSLTRSWEELQDASFRLQVTDDDIIKGEDYYK